MKPMKLFYLASLIIFSFSLTSYSQAIRIVDNNGNAPAEDNVTIFYSLQSAINTADPGDIIQIKGSPNSYGNATIDKQLTIQGIGFNLTKEFPEQSIVGTLTLANKADDSDNASGTIITGVIATIINLGSIVGTSYTLSDVVIDNCQVGNIIQSSSYAGIDNLEVKYTFINGTTTTYDLSFSGFVDNSTIRNCVVQGFLLFNSAAVSNNIIANNILYGAIYFNAINTNTLVVHNLFMGDAGSSSYSFYVDFNDNFVQNNIFYGRDTRMVSGSSFQNNTFGNNLSWGGGSANYLLPPTGVGGSNFDDPGTNLPNTQPEFVNTIAFSSTWSASYDFTLSPTSPAKGAASNGIDDLGIMDGPFPFATGNLVLRTTATPTVESLTTSGVVNPGDNLNVKIKVKGN